MRLGVGGVGTGHGSPPSGGLVVCHGRPPPHPSPRPADPAGVAPRPFVTNTGWRLLARKERGAVKGGPRGKLKVLIQSFPPPSSPTP